MDNHETPHGKPDLTPAHSAPRGDSPDRAAARSWLAQNGPMLLLPSALFFYCWLYLGWSPLTMAKVAGGLGLVIFIHELGHFLVAKWCDVHVETFSIGFGPALPGCCFRRGETTYMIALFPLGGYVKMVGEGDSSEEDEDDPRSFKNKTVGQRMAIISAGVVMNVILACICFIFVYTVYGDDRLPGVVERIENGSPAWQIGIQGGDVIKRIGSIENPSFNNDLMPQVMLSRRGEKLPIVFGPPGGTLHSTDVEPRRNSDDLKPVIGITHSSRLTLPKGKYNREDRALPVYYTSAAATAKGSDGHGFDFDDEIVGSTDPDAAPGKPYDPANVKELPADPRDSTGERRDYFEFQRRLQRLAGKPVVVQVRRLDAPPSSPPVDIRLNPEYQYVLGMRMRMGRVSAIRNDSPAERAALQGEGKEAAPGIRAGDLLKAIEVTDSDGKKIRWVYTDKKDLPSGERHLDPIRLPNELEAWAERLGEADERAKAADPSAKALSRTVVLTVLRSNPKNHQDDQEVNLSTDWDDQWKFDNAVPYSVNSPTSISGLGIAYRVEPTIDAVAPGSPADQAGLKQGDVVKAFRFYQAGKKVGDEEPRRWQKLEAGQWAFVPYALQSQDYKKLGLRVDQGDGKPIEVTLTAVPDNTWPSSERGLMFNADVRLTKAKNFGEAMAWGVNRTRQFIGQIYLHLEGLLTNRLSIENMAGPIFIAQKAYSIAGDNFFQFVLFLGMISVNLAVINFLPIPVLDGGHMVFLIYEKLRGKPASENVRIAATYMGLALIASLMIFVIYLDVRRLLSS